MVTRPALVATSRSEASPSRFSHRVLVLAAALALPACSSSEPRQDFPDASGGSGAGAGRAAGGSAGTGGSAGSGMPGGTAGAGATAGGGGSAGSAGGGGGSAGTTGQAANLPWLHVEGN